MLLRSISYAAVADPDTPEYEAVQNANVSPIIGSFPIEAFGPDSGRG